jgi:hypothetical protein
MYVNHAKFLQKTVDTTKYVQYDACMSIICIILQVKL